MGLPRYPAPTSASEAPQHVDVHPSVGHPVDAIQLCDGLPDLVAAEWIAPAEAIVDKHGKYVVPHWLCTNFLTGWADNDALRRGICAALSETWQEVCEAPAGDEAMASIEDSTCSFWVAPKNMSTRPRM